MKTIFRTIIIASAALLAAACGSNAGKQTEQQTAAVVAEDPTVAVVEVFTREVPQEAVYTSTVQAYAKNNIAPQMAGRITKINVEIGDFVKEGQILAEIDKAQLLQAQLQLQNQEVELQRLKSLYEAGGLSQSDYDAIQMQYNVLKTQVENLIENTTEDGILYMNKGDSDEHLGAYGWYGHPYKQNGETQMRYHVIRNEGQSANNGGNCNNKISADYKAAMKAGAGEWYDIVIEIDGYKMNAYFNGLELGLGDSLGMFDMTAEATASNGNTSDLAFIGRMYNCLNTVSIKDVAVYKGIGLDLSQEGGDDTTAPEGGNDTTAPETTPSKPSMVYNKLNVALWTNVGGVGADNQLKAEQVANIKAGLEKVLTDAGYDLSKVSIEWTDLCADGGHGVEALVPLTNDGDFDVVLGAGTNAITKGLNAVELKPMVVENTKRQAVLIDDNNAMAKVLYEYITTGNTTGYPAPPQTGDASMFVAISLIAIISLGGAVLVSKKRFN